MTVGHDIARRLHITIVKLGNQNSKAVKDIKNEIAQILMYSDVCEKREQLFGAQELLVEIQRQRIVQLEVQLQQIQIENRIISNEVVALETALKRKKQAC